MGFYTIDKTDLEKMCRIRHNSVLLFMNYLQTHTKSLLYSTKAFDRVPHALLIKKLLKIETIDEYLL